MVVITIPLFLMFGVYLLAKYFPTMAFNNEHFNNGNFGDPANWLQALAALWAVAVTAAIAFQIFEVKKQTLIEQERAATEAYRPLISGHMQSIKRFLCTDEIDEALRSLDKALDHLTNPLPAELHELLKKLRSTIAWKAKFIKLPLLGRNASLDDIESLINEYNYLCKLLLDETIGHRFATEMAMVNFVNIHRRLSPFLRLRRLLSPQYASHFSRFVDRTDGTAP
jgi:hypothetical protein